MRPEIVCGIEIEMEYNDRHFLVNKESYHSSCAEWFSDYFVAERDSSLHPERWGGTAEIISVPFLLGDYKRVLEDFKEGVYSKVAQAKQISLEGARQIGMDDLVNFNDSTGAHIHLSVIDLDKPFPSAVLPFRGFSYMFNGSVVPIRTIATFGFLRGFTPRLEKKVRVALPKVYDEWRIRLYREYASKICPDDIDLVAAARGNLERRREWNITEESEHIEYRSFHLKGVYTWEEFDKIWECAFGLIQDYFAGQFRRKRPFLGVDREVKVSLGPGDLREKDLSMEDEVFIKDDVRMDYEVFPEQTQRRHRYIAVME